PPAISTARSYCGKDRSAYSGSPECGTGMAIRAGIFFIVAPPLRGAAAALSGYGPLGIIPLSRFPPTPWFGDNGGSPSPLTAQIRLNRPRQPRERQCCGKPALHWLFLPVIWRRVRFRQFPAASLMRMKESTAEE